MILKNYMEEVAFRAFDDVTKGMDICKCEKCKLDIIAIALNKLPTKYVVTDKGELYAKVDNLRGQFEADIITAMTQAAMTVGKNPKH